MVLPQTDVLATLMSTPLNKICLNSMLLPQNDVLAIHDDDLDTLHFWKYFELIFGN